MLILTVWPRRGLITLERSRQYDSHGGCGHKLAAAELLPLVGGRPTTDRSRPMRQETIQAVAQRAVLLGLLTLCASTAGGCGSGSFRWESPPAGGAFGNVPRGQHEVRIFTAKNSTAGELEIKKVSVRGDTAFSEENNKCSEKLRLKAGEACSVEVTFKPSRGPVASYTGKLVAEFVTMGHSQGKEDKEILTGENK
jgi:Cep192 domain 4